MAKPEKSDSQKDPRFAVIGSDPRFRIPKKKAIRGDVDSRFKSAIRSDARFNHSLSIDKYGRRVEKPNAEEELSRYYNFSDSDSSENGEDNATGEDDPKVGIVNGHDSENARDRRKEVMRARMRGEDLSDESLSDELEDTSSDESEDSEGSKVGDEVDEYEKVHGEVAPSGEETRRLAVVNMDWDNVSAVDLMATLSSFLPVNHRILSVRIFPSEYGKKRMQEEELNGPPIDLFDAEEEISNKPGKPAALDDDEIDGDEDYSSSKLRRYQLQRLRYYYAIVECDSPGAAAAIYGKCDGTEYESTANFFDLRFVPDDVMFNEETPKDECSKVPAKYEPRQFATDALQHSRVRLTWDETPVERVRMAQKSFGKKEIEDMDLKAYLASDSDSDGEDTATKYREMLETPLGGGNKTDKDDVDMEITFNPALDGDGLQSGLDSTQKDDEPEAEEELSTIEKYRRKEKERRRQRLERAKQRREAETNKTASESIQNKQELELMAMDDDILAAAPSRETQNGQSRSMTRRATVRKAQEAAEQEFDTSDPRFQALFDDPDYAIDATAPQFKKTKAMENVVGERRRRQAKQEKLDVKGSEKNQPSRKRHKLTRESREEGAKQLAAKLAAKLGQ